MAKRAAETAANPENQAKQLRSNFDEAKKLLDTIPLVHWRLQVHRWEWLVETTDQNLAILQRGIERTQVAPSTHLENQREKVYTLAQETLQLMDETSKLVSQGRVGEEIHAMFRFIEQYGRPPHERVASAAELRAIDAKVIYYARHKDS